MTTPSLGSGVAVAIYNRTNGSGGMLHFLLPAAAIDSELSAERPEFFADTGIELLVHQMELTAQTRSDLEAWIVGGADCFFRGHGECELALGQRNVEAAEKALAAAQIEIAGRRVGGSMARRLTLDLSIGKPRIHETPMARRDR